MRFSKAVKAISRAVFSPAVRSQRSMQSALKAKIGGTVARKREIANTLAKRMSLAEVIAHEAHIRTVERQGEPITFAERNERVMMIRKEALRALGVGRIVSEHAPHLSRVMKAAHEMRYTGGICTGIAAKRIRSYLISELSQKVKVDEKTYSGILKDAKKFSISGPKSNLGKLSAEEAKLTQRAQNTARVFYPTLQENVKLIRMPVSLASLALILAEAELKETLGSKLANFNKRVNYFRAEEGLV